MMSGNVDDRYLSAPEAAQALGVSVQTLYVYVGRKGIRSQEVPGSRRRKYWKADVERVRLGERASVPSPAGSFSPETAITLITQTDVFYRGLSATDLADAASFENVAALLWGANEADIFTPKPPAAPPLFAKLNKLLGDQDDVNRATALFPIFENANPRAFDLTPEGMARTGAEILRWLAAITARSIEPPTGPIHRYLADAFQRGPEDAELIRRMLILSADHGFEPGTVAVRSVASTGVTPWRSVIAGLSISFGRRGHLGGIEAVRRFLREVEESADPAAPVIQRIRDGEELPGFTSPIYAHGDPRGRALLAAASELLAGDPALARLQAAIVTAREIRDVEPNFALGFLFLLNRLGMGPRSALFHLGRAAGWIAHSIEQYQTGEMHHRAETYVGPLPR